MHFVSHLELRDKHAFLSPSRYHWVNYDLDKLDKTYMTWRAQEVGTKLHEFAKNAIELGVRMPDDNQTLNMYINDAIYFNMTPEQPLYYSENAFGTADAIIFDERNSTLRVHDLKTGSTRASLMQLLVYDALFCLEYKRSPYDIHFINRIYQSNDIIENEPDQDDVRRVMDKIIEFDIHIDKLKRGVPEN